MLPPQGGPGFKVPIGGGAGVEPWAGPDKLPGVPLESLAKLLSTPVLRLEGQAGSVVSSPAGSPGRWGLPRESL